MSSGSNTDIQSGHESSCNDAMALRAFRACVADRTGILIPESDGPKIRRLLSDRLHTCGTRSIADYCRLLRSAGGEAAEEWEMLYTATTVAETYFFRDEELFRLLRLQLLPEIIRRNRKHRTLRLWCAGCSSGEEAYSLAMVVDHLLPASAGWQVTILGTDLNAAAIARARQGIYPAWSVSRAREPLLQRYCQGSGETWVVAPRIRGMVRFEQGNLLAEPFPALEGGGPGLDIILCRNVFIYFTPEAVIRVLDTLVASLKPEGYLLTGPGDVPSGIKNEALRPLLFPEAVVYQRLVSPLPPAPVGPVTVMPLRQPAVEPPIPSTLRSLPDTPRKSPTSQPKTPSDPRAILAEAVQAFGAGDYHRAIARVGEVLALTPGDLSAHCLIAWAYANQGDMVKAREWAHRAIGIDSLAVSPYYLLAQLAEAHADPVQALALLKKVIYLDQHFIPAYLDLAAIYAAAGETDKAGRQRLAAQALIRNMRDELPLEPYVVLRRDESSGIHSSGQQGLTAGVGPHTETIQARR